MQLYYTTMGLYDIIELENEITLPKFKGEINDVEWQSKDVQGRPFMATYKITNDGRLMEQKVSKRPMTDEEIKERANQAGYDSWDEWEQDEAALGPIDSWKQVTDEVWWEDCNQHGSFEMHALTYEGEESTYWSYEVRFTDGELDEIILLSKS